MRELTITVPTLPPKEWSPNARTHWAPKAKVAVEAHSDVIALVREQGWKGNPMDAARIEVSWGVKDKRRRDTDNFVGRTKPYIDGLVLAGVLVDDSRYNVTYEFSWHKADQSETVITVKEQ